MTPFSKSRSRKGMHIFEWITVFVAVAVGITLMVKLTKAYWNARMKSQDVQITESFYDKFPTGTLTDPGGGCADCSEWVPINACGVGECDICEKIAFRGCDIGCGETEKCFFPGDTVPDCPGCSEKPATDPCLGVTKNYGCWSDEPSQELIDLVGVNANGTPTVCAWGQLITEAIDCTVPGGVPEIKCIPDGTCEFECNNISEQFIGFWYFPCDPQTDPPTNPPLNGNTDATFIANGECSGEPCEFQCPPGFEIESNGTNNTNYGNTSPSPVCECPFDGGNPDPYMVVVENGVPTCVCDGPLTPSYCFATPPSGDELPGTPECQGYGPPDCFGNNCCYQQGVGCIGCMDFCSQFDDNEAGCMNHAACGDWNPAQGGSGPNGEYICDEPIIVDPGGGGCCASDWCHLIPDPLGGPPTCSDPLHCDENNGCTPLFQCNSQPPCGSFCEWFNPCPSGGNGPLPGSCHPCPAAACTSVNCCMNSWPDPLGDPVCEWDTICSDPPNCDGTNQSTCNASGCFWY